MIHTAKCIAHHTHIQPPPVCGSRHITENKIKQGKKITNAELHMQQQWASDRYHIITTKLMLYGLQ